MQLSIDGVRHTFTPMREYRAQHGLPPEFGVALFEPKDYRDLGSIEGVEAGAALNSVRAAVLAALPPALTPDMLLTTPALLTEVFRAQLYAINRIVGLREVEVEFAVAGFADVVQNYAYALVRARLGGAAPPDFWAVYGAWLESSARVAYTEHEYAHAHSCEVWRVQVVSHAYGRAGLVVERGSADADYVVDGALACPADGFMAGLLREVCGGLSTSTSPA
jgi:hypothetical protein